MAKTVIALIIFILAAVIFITYTQPTYGQVGLLQQQIAQYNAALDKASQLDQLKQSLVTRYNSFSSADMTRLQTMLPDHVDNIALILDLDNLANRYGMALQNVNVSLPNSNSGGQAGASPTIGSAAGTNTGQKYASITLQFSTFGSYTSFRAFLQALESSLRIVDVTQFSIAPQGGGSTPGYSYSMTLRTYWLQP